MDWRMSELVRTLKDKDVVVFHCALSQQRGPAAALRYLRERERLLGTTAADANTEQATGLDKEEQKGAKEGLSKSKGQEIFVLQGGFVKWQEKLLARLPLNNKPTSDVSQVRRGYEAHRGLPKRHMGIWVLKPLSIVEYGSSPMATSRDIRRSLERQSALRFVFFAMLLKTVKR